MNNDKLVSVIIPCYNQGEFLEECLTSVFNSTYQSIEVIVVNDGSTDNTSTIIESLKLVFKINVIHQTNKGLAETRNVGIKHSKGRFILPLDADDRIGETYIENAVKVLLENESIGIVYCQAELFEEKTGLWRLPDYTFEKMLTQNLIFNCALFRRKDYDNTTGYNSNMKEGWEDWDFWLSLLELNLKVFRLDEIGFYYRIRKNSMVRSLNAEKNKGLREHIYKNHINLYLEHFENPIQQHHQINELEGFKQSFYHLKNSLDFRLGRLLLLPLRTILNLFKK